ncbi:MAG TPA: thermostable hemolysin [Burkholderiales bacterium]
MEYGKARVERETVPRRCLVAQSGPSRKEAEAFIAAHFRVAHQAHIRQFMPTLLGARDDHGRLIIACGLRAAERERRFFLESYLKQPVEAALSSAMGGTVTRARVVEVGNLAAASPATARELIAALTHYLSSAPFEWVVFTGVAALRNSFRRLGIPLVDLGSALLEALPEEARDDWGDYYRSSPRVCAVSIYESRIALNRCGEKAA